MRWGRKWGTYVKVPGNPESKVETRWGGDRETYPTDGLRVTVKIINSKFYPCSKCRYRFNKSFPKTHTHSLYQQYLEYLKNVSSGRGQNFITSIGECNHYKESK